MPTLVDVWGLKSRRGQNSINLIYKDLASITSYFRPLSFILTLEELHGISNTQVVIAIFYTLTPLLLPDEILFMRLPVKKKEKKKKNSTKPTLKINKQSNKKTHTPKKKKKKKPKQTKQ